MRSAAQRPAALRAGKIVLLWFLKTAHYQKQLRRFAAAAGSRNNERDNAVTNVVASSSPRSRYTPSSEIAQRTPGKLCDDNWDEARSSSTKEACRKPSA